jgi:hypothetical protein
VKPTVDRYENPRKMPQRWVDLYLERDRGQLALDVMRAFDANYALKARLESSHIWTRILSCAVVVAWAAIGWLVTILIPLVTHR